jgi:hypothetical protein
MARLKSLERSRVGPFRKRIDARLEFLMCDKSTVLEDLIENHRAINALLRR